MIAFGIYLLIGLAQLFAIWLARDKEKLNLNEAFLCIFIWPYLWIIVLLSLNSPKFWGEFDKVQFLKVWLALLSIAIIILVIIK